jgi:hypothetical protein
MRLLIVGLTIGLSALLTTAQQPARIGPDGKPLLNRPIVEECKKRVSHMVWNGHNYFLSWREPWHKFEDWDWFNGRNFCRDRCMDLVSFDTPGEFQLFQGIMRQDNVSSIYTSGRKCNFKGKGCDAAHLQPINVNGWFWAGANNKRILPTNEPNAESFWSKRGESGKPQPDNHEGIAEGPISTEFDIGITIEGLQEFHDEACLAVLNNKYNDDIVWHDVACHYRSVIVCEDSDQLIELVKSQDSEDVQDSVKSSDKGIVDPDSIIGIEAQRALTPPPRQFSGNPNQLQQFGFPGGRPKARPARRPAQGGLIGNFRNRFPFLF